MNARDAGFAVGAVGAVLLIAGLTAGTTRRGGPGDRSARALARPSKLYVVDGVGYLLPKPSEGHTWAEWERSGTAEAHGIDNRIYDLEHQRNVSYLSTFLDAVERRAGAPVRITSGYRVPELNDLLEGSAEHSRHMSGEAVDFSIPERFATSMDLAKFVYGTGMPFQKIGVYPGESRIHLQYTPVSAPLENRRRFVYHSATGDPVSFA